jgi:hypothetical protein
MMFRLIGVGAMALVVAASGVVRAQSGGDLSTLHDALHLSARQEDAWRSYKAAISPDPYAASRHRSATMLMATLPTPRRVDLINAELEENLAVVRRQGEAVKAFYAALTPDQQRTFDHQTLQTGGDSRGGNGGSNGPALRQPTPGQTLPQPQ